MRIIFELIAGPLNGIYSGELGQPSTVLTWYHASNNGEIGREFVVDCPGPAGQPQQQRYRVTNCAQRDQTIHIAAVYEGPT